MQFRRQRLGLLLRTIANSDSLRALLWDGMRVVRCNAPSQYPRSPIPPYTCANEGANRAFQPPDNHQPSSEKLAVDRGQVLRESLESRDLWIRFAMAATRGRPLWRKLRASAERLFLGRTETVSCTVCSRPRADDWGLRYRTSKIRKADVGRPCRRQCRVRLRVICP